LKKNLEVLCLRGPRPDVILMHRAVSFAGGWRLLRPMLFSGHALAQGMEIETPDPPSVIFHTI
jgi:hypothetical protein